MKIISTIASAALVASAFVPVTFVPSTAAQAGSPSQEQCEADGGVFRRDGGQVYCDKSYHVGNSDNSQTVDDSESSNGTFNNNPKHQEDCDGTGNSQDGTDHCRPN